MTVTTCQPCKQQGRTLQALKWCINCGEGLCDPCVAYHSVLNWTRNHDYLDIEEYEQESELLSKVSIVCKMHGKTITDICNVHGCPCCYICYETYHSDCNVTNIAEQDIENQWMDAEVETANNIELMMNLSKDVCKNRSDIMESLEKKYMKILSKLQRHKDVIQTLVTTIDKHIDTLNQMYDESKNSLASEKDVFFNFEMRLRKKRQSFKILNKLKSVPSYHFLVQREIQSFSKSCKSNLGDEIEKLKNIDLDCKTSFGVVDDGDSVAFTAEINFDNTKNCDFDLCYPLETGSSTEEAEERRLDDIANQKPTKDQTLSEINEAIHDCTANANTVTDKDTETNIEGVSQNLPTSMVNEKPSLDFFLRFHVDWQSGNTDIRCMCILPNGRTDIVLGERSGRRLLVYAKYGNRISECQLPGKPVSIAAISSKTFAITSGKSVLVYEFINRKSLKKLKTIDMHDDCHGIAATCNILAVNCESRGVTIIKTESELASIAQSEKGILHMCGTKDGKVLYVKEGYSAVRVIDTKDFTDTSLTISCEKILGANGVSQDENGNVYISCDVSKTVYEYTCKANNWTAILGDKNDIGIPSRICYDSKTKMLAFVSKGGKAVNVYKVKTK